MCRVPEAGHELLDVLVHEGVVGDVIYPLVVLLGGGQLAVDEQVRHLEVIGLLRKLLDRIAAVGELPVVAVEVGDGAAAGRGVDESRIEAGQPGVVDVDLDLAELAGPNGTVVQWQLVGTPGSVVCHGQGLAWFEAGSPALLVLRHAHGRTSLSGSAVAASAASHRFDFGSHGNSRSKSKAGKQDGLARGAAPRGAGRSASARPPLPARRAARRDQRRGPPVGPGDHRLPRRLRTAALVATDRGG